MPLAKTDGNSTPDGLLEKILRSTDTARQKSVEQTVVESSKQRWCKSPFGKQRMCCSFCVTINQDF